MNSEYGYIYIRDNSYYKLSGVYKMGITTNIPHRESGYITCEIDRGKFIEVFQVKKNELDLIDKKLKDYFKHINVKKNAGTEFFKRDLINYLDPFFQENKIEYKKLLEEEINNLIRGIREDIKEELIPLKQIKNPYESQIPIISKIIQYFEKNDKGLLILPCGFGKTCISLWVIKQLNFNKVLIGVPNLLLLKQWLKSVYDIFPGINTILEVAGGVKTKDIINFLNNNMDNCIVLTTYHSSHKIYSATKSISFKFDMVINDETHHLTTENIDEEGKKTFINMIKIKSDKQLSLTATMKVVESDLKIIANDSKDHFGEIIERKTLLEAITQDIICDYGIQTIYSNSLEDKKIITLLDKLLVNDDSDKKLFLAAYVALLSIYNNDSHHLLIYANNIKNCEKIIKYITALIKEKYFDRIKNDLYYSKYISEIDKEDQEDILDNYNESKYGIISCVYCLGEGYDNKIIDGVVFGENMNSSIRIVQSALRAGRKNPNEKTKKTKIILPILNKTNLMGNNNPDLLTVREVVNQMGLEDETIMQKITAYKIDIVKKEKDKKINSEEKSINITHDEELTKAIRLKTENRIVIGISYEKAKQFISCYKINSKEDYYKICDKDIRLSREPEELYGDKFTNWIDYLDIKRVYYDLKTCIEMIKKYIDIYPEIRNNFLNLSYVCNKLCSLDNKFPPNDLWVEYYKVKELNDIIKISTRQKKPHIFL